MRNFRLWGCCLLMRLGEENERSQTQFFKEFYLTIDFSHPPLYKNDCVHCADCQAKDIVMKVLHISKKKFKEEQKEEKSQH